MTAFLPRGIRWLEVGAVLALFLVIQVSANDTDLASSADCYYNYNHYSEGDRILTNEPCLNCTCHNKMLMCYLKVCPFTKPIGQDCTIEKREDQCCPIITCPEVPVELDHSSAQSSTDLATHHNHGCSIDGHFFPEGAQIPGNPKKPCELCYCIRNMTSCVMQECTLHVDGCRPIYNKGVCCPVRYDCAHDDDLPPMIEDQTTTEAPSQGFIITTTSAPPPSTDCYHNGIRYNDGESIDTERPCEHCYCMRGDIVCAVQECKPVEMHGKNCTARLPGPGECCPQVYECESDMQTTTPLLDDDMGAATTLGYRGDDVSLSSTTLQPSEHLEKDAITTEAGSIGDTTSPRIDESENEIHDKDYHDHMTGAKPSRTNLTAPPMPSGVDDRLESDESTTLLNKLDSVAATTILSESGAMNDEEMTTVLPIPGRPQVGDEKETTENQGILNNLYTTIKSIVDLAQTTLAPEPQPRPKPQDEEDSFSNVIPGEGDCLENGISYENNTSVPPQNVCDESCLCHNSIVRCEKVKCAPMPPNAENCKILHEDGLCCPSYHCESMEFSTGPPPTHPVESQIIHRDDNSTPASPSSIEQQTNAIDGDLDSTTVQAAKAPISSKLDDSYEMKPELSTEGKVEKETSAPEIESLTPIKMQGEQPSGELQPTEQAAKDERTTQSATTMKSEQESSTTQYQSHTVERIKPDGKPAEQEPEIMQTTDKIDEKLPDESATTASPMQDASEQELSSTPSAEKLPEEIQPTTPPTSSTTPEVIGTTLKDQPESEVSSEAQQPSVPQEEQTPDEKVTTEAALVDKMQDISTEQQPSASSSEAQKPDEFVPTESQPEDQKPSESATTLAPSADENQQEGEISTESQPPAPQEDKKQDEAITTERTPEQKVPEVDISTEQQPSEGQKQDEMMTTAAPAVDEKQPEDEISTEAQPAKQPEVQKQDEAATTQTPSGQKAQPESEISTDKFDEEIPTTETPSKEKIPSADEMPSEATEPSKQPEEQKPDEFVTTEQPSEKKKPEPEISTEKQTDVEQPADGLATTLGPMIQKDEMPTEKMPELLKPDEQVTTEKSEQVPESTEQSEKQPTEPSVEQTTPVKLAEEPVEAITTRITEAQTPEKKAEDSTEMQRPDEEITEKTMENAIPDSSTDAQIDQQMTTEKRIEPADKISDEPITTEKPSPVEQEATEQSSLQTTAKSEEPTTSAPKPIAQEPIATEKQPEINEISSESLPMEEHYTEKDIYIPATEEQPAIQEEEKQPQPIPTTAAPEAITTERTAEEQTTLAASKLNLGGVDQNDFKDGEIVSPDEKQDLDEGDNVTTEPPQKSELDETDKQEPIATEQPVPSEKPTEVAPIVADEKQPAVETTEKQPSPEATTMYIFPSKQEDMEIITEMVDLAKPEDEMEPVTMQKDQLATTESPKPEQVTESKAQYEPSSTQAPIEVEATTMQEGEAQEPQKPSIADDMIPSEEIEKDQTTLSPSATEKQQPAEPSEQTTLGTIVEKSTEESEIKPMDLMPTTQPPPKPELESDNQMHINNEKQPEIQFPVTTEASKQDEPAQETTVPSAVPAENVNRIGEQKPMAETTAKPDEPQSMVTEPVAVSSEIPKQEQPNIPLATTEQNIVDITTLLNKIHDETTTQKPEPEQEKPQPAQQTEQPQRQTEAAIPDVSMTTEQGAISMDQDVTTAQAAQQPAEPDSTQQPEINVPEIPSEPTTAQPEMEQTTFGVESTPAPSPSSSSSVQPMIEPSQSTPAPGAAEQTTQYEMEKQTTESQAQDFSGKDEIQPTTQKDEIEPMPTESQDKQSAPIAPETTAVERVEAITSTAAPVKLDEQPTEAAPTERIEPATQQDEIQQPTTKPSILDGTTIKSVVELLTTLHPKEPSVDQQEPEITTSQPTVGNRVDSESSPSTAQPQEEPYTTEAISVPQNKTEDETVTEQQTMAPPPESSNKIPLIREPSHDDMMTTTKLAESFDTTTLPSILLTSSHTERISDSTTIKNTQSEIIETTSAPPQMQQFTEGTMPQQSMHEHDTQSPFPAAPDMGYGNVPPQYPDEEYGDEEEPTIFGPGTCRYGGKLYVSAQQIPRDDPCDFCFCFRSDIICLQQSCPPPINGCHEEPIQGFCCPRYECPVSMALVLNATTTTTTTLPPYLSHFQRNVGKLTRSGCQVQGQTYKIGERITTASGPCIDCICGGDGNMKCEPKVCTPEPMLRQMIASAKRR